MIKKTMLASCTLVASMASHAALISYNGYERDTAKNYVTGGGLEWLMWDETKGSSIESALASYAAQGWRLASNLEMAELFNKFHLTSEDFGNNENIAYVERSPWSPLETSVYSTFQSMFGITHITPYGCDQYYRIAYCYDARDMPVQSAAMYGADLDGDLKYNLAWVIEDSTYYFEDSSNASYDPHYLEMSNDFLSPDVSYSTVGIALVRVSRAHSVTVPTPGPIGLLALGLFALGYRRRQVLGR